MSTSKKMMLRANILYAITTYGLFALMLIISVISAMLALAGNLRFLSPYTASYNIVMVVAEAVPTVLPGAIMLLTRSGRPMLKTMRLGIRPSVLLAIPTAAVGYIFILGITSIWTGLLTSMGLGMEPSASVPQGGVQLASSLAVIALCPALCEEFLFRGLMLPAYERYFKSPVAAVALTGLVFGLMHGQVTGAPGHILLGLLFGAVVVLSDSIWAGVIFHFVNNAVAMLLAYAATGFQQNFGMSAAQEAVGSQPFVMMMGGGVYALVGAAGLAGCLAIYYACYKRGARKRVSAPEVILPEELAALNLSAKQPGRFLCWLPLLLSAPIAVTKYVLSFATMLMGVFLP